MRRKYKPAELARVKLGQAIERAQTSLVAECRDILDSTIGGSSAGPSGLGVGNRFLGVTEMCRPITEFCR